MLPGLLLCMSVVAGCQLAGKILMHYFQLESYQFPGYFRTLRRNLLKAMLPGICMTFLLAVLSLLILLLSPAHLAGQGMEPTEIILTAGMILLIIAGGLFLGRILSEKKAKKAFVLTVLTTLSEIFRNITILKGLIFLLKPKRRRGCPSR